MTRRRCSKQRDLIFDAVQRHIDHPSADDIYMAVRAENPHISRGTIYRNLKLMAENGDIRQVKISGADRFDYRQDPHYHMLCTCCGKVTDIPLPYRTELDNMMADQTGYKVTHHRIIFEGICPDCFLKQDIADIS